MSFQQAVRNSISNAAKMNPEYLMPCLAPKAPQSITQNRAWATPKVVGIGQAMRSAVGPWDQEY